MTEPRDSTAPRDESGRGGIDERADAIVVAAGASRRMDGIDKVWAEVGGRPMLARTLDAIAAAASVARIVVVVAPEQLDGTKSATWLPRKVVDVVGGGRRRQESVAAGFWRLMSVAEAGDDRVVLVHDGARPLVSAALVDAVATAARRRGAAIPVVPIAETLKRLDGDVVAGTVDRVGVGAAQTPQGVRVGLLRAALARFPADGPDTFTDEAALLEACRIPVHAIPGEPSNFKVTVPDDFRRAETALLAESATRIGFGADSHPFGPGDPLVLGGVELPGAPRLHGHSDGDVVLHAVADALLGAAGMGDLGRLFPADARTPRGVSSAELLAEVVRRFNATGRRAIAIDVTVVAARPRLGERLDDIRARVAALIGVQIDAVSVKASTGNLSGMEGAGRGISAQAVVLVGAAR
ncbi:MAG TPA: 2-C-methyl-D-erythritol 2,4-cyclodiphosphate synthase [Candidatus Limnocylindrales bacterium]|nr:2-C-methyl-D-erythritol 2,4-cyclodiphosphate synthase [Candidatus Limnocylindrales bacterium]